MISIMLCIVFELINFTFPPCNRTTKLKAPKVKRFWKNLNVKTFKMNLKVAEAVCALLSWTLPMHLLRGLAKQK